MTTLYAQVTNGAITQVAPPPTAPGYGPDGAWHDYRDPAEVAAMDDDELAEQVADLIGDCYAPGIFPATWRTAALICMASPQASSKRRGS